MIWSRPKGKVSSLFEISSVVLLILFVISESAATTSQSLAQITWGFETWQWWCYRSRPGLTIKPVTKQSLAPTEDVGERGTYNTESVTKQSLAPTGLRKYCILTADLLCKKIACGVADFFMIWSRSKGKVSSLFEISSVVLLILFVISESAATTSQSLAQITGGFETWQWWCYRSRPGLT